MEPKKIHVLIFAFCFFYGMNSAYSCSVARPLEKGKLGYGKGNSTYNRAVPVEIFVYNKFYSGYEKLYIEPKGFDIQVKDVNGEDITADSIYIKFEIPGDNGITISIAQIMSNAALMGNIYAFSKHRTRTTHEGKKGILIKFNVFTTKQLLTNYNHRVTLSFSNYQQCN